jgi:hypothetical protein
MESTRNSMDPRDNEKHEEERDNEKHEEEYEDSKKERRITTTSHSIKNHKITSLI